SNPLARSFEFSQMVRPAAPHPPGWLISAPSPLRPLPLAAVIGFDKRDWSSLRPRNGNFPAVDPARLGGGLGHWPPCPIAKPLLPSPRQRYWRWFEKLPLSPQTAGLLGPATLLPTLARLAVATDFARPHPLASGTWGPAR